MPQYQPPVPPVSITRITVAAGAEPGMHHHPYKGGGAAAAPAPGKQPYQIDYIGLARYVGQYRSPPLMVDAEEQAAVELTREIAELSTDEARATMVPF